MRRSHRPKRLRPLVQEMGRIFSPHLHIKLVATRLMKQKKIRGRCERRYEIFYSFCFAPFRLIARNNYCANINTINGGANAYQAFHYYSVLYFVGKRGWPGAATGMQLLLYLRLNNNRYSVVSSDRSRFYVCCKQRLIHPAIETRHTSLRRCLHVRLNYYPTARKCVQQCVILIKNIPMKKEPSTQ